MVFVGTRQNMEPLIEIAELNGIEILGFLDRFYVGQKFEGFDVIGSDLDLLDKSNKEMQQLIEQADFFVSTFFGGRTNTDNLNENTYYLRLERMKMVKDANCNLANLIHPTASVSKTTKMGRNTLIMGYAFIESYCNIGSFCTFMYQNTIGHHSTIGNNCSFMPGATGCAGNVVFGDNVLVGADTKIMASGEENTTVGDNVIISPKMGIFKSIPSDSIVQVNGKISKNDFYNAKNYDIDGIISGYKRVHT
jgi:acyl-[acyl carrier protein]--UDP-N-acetylglucosamine O-acyltransferase